jgi:chromosome segregation ATPase
MGFRDWFSRKPAAPSDPLRAYDARLDALAERAALLRRSAATLLAVRRDLDRKLLALQQRTTHARAQAERARDEPDVRAVLEADLERLGRDGEALTLQRARVDQDALALTGAVGTVEQERETLSREREGAQVQLAATGAVLAARPALEDRIDELIRLDAARDEVERAHALAEIYREDAARKPTRVKG